MRVLLVREALARSVPPGQHALSIGVFDGVHRGHRALISRLLAEATQHGLGAGIVTFHPSPVTVLHPEAEFAYLESLEQRVELLREAGAAFVSVVPFTSELAQVSAQEFARLLVDAAGMRLLVVGEDFAFGRGRQGTVPFLRELGVTLGFEVLTVPLVAEGEDRVSSTRVRRTLAAGEMEAVAALLGRPYAVRGPVLHGDERGRTIGFPTLNLGVSADRALPPNGVYVSRARLEDGREFAGCTNIGLRPTFDGQERRFETHLLDFEGDLYGTQVSVALLHRLRDERRFDGPQALVAQIRRDVEETRAHLAGAGGAR